MRYTVKVSSFAKKQYRCNNAYRILQFSVPTVRVQIKKKQQEMELLLNKGQASTMDGICIVKTFAIPTFLKKVNSNIVHSFIMSTIAYQKRETAVKTILMVEFIILIRETTW